MLTNLLLASFLILSSCQHLMLREPQGVPAEDALIPACVKQSQKSTFSAAKGRDSRFGECSKGRAFPRRGAVPSAADAEVVSSSFNTMTNCLGVSNPKKLMALFSGESGYYMNAFGGAGELGIGQLSKGAIMDVSAVIGDVQNRWLHSANPECRELAGKSELWRKSSYNQGCEFMSGELGVQRNLLYALVYHTILEKWIDQDLERFQIAAQLESLGLQESAGFMKETPSWELPPETYHRRDLLGLLSSVSYNAGARGVVNYLQKYLEYKLRSKIALTKKDFNFKEDLSYLNALSREQLAKVPVKDISFPAYLKIYQRWGHPGYGPDMMRLIYRFNESVGPHVCTPERIEGFLAL